METYFTYNYNTYCAVLSGKEIIISKVLKKDNRYYKDCVKQLISYPDRDLIEAAYKAFNDNAPNT